MDEVKTKFLKTQETKIVVCFQYVNDIFFVWKHGKNLNCFLKTWRIFFMTLKKVLRFWILIFGYSLITDLH